VNAARAVNVSLEERWPINAIEAREAWKTATGRGVVVAVVDQGFHVNNPIFAGHLIDKKAFYPGTFDPPQNFHGTSMAKIVLAVAPDASLVFLNHGERTDMTAAKAHAFAQCVDYAVAKGVNVITSSAAPWPNTPEVWAAIDRAVAAGVAFVWINYQGPNEAVIRPTYLWLRGDIGAFDRFFDDDKPSDLEGGLSDTSPQIAAIAALILQDEPGLTPLEVKQRIVSTATPLGGGCFGCTIANAAGAVTNPPPSPHRIRPHLP
jgi:subtilisin family serine protease